jgi:hypothetical protein
MYYWQIAGRHEVDFVLEIGDGVIAIEVKAGARWGNNDLSGLQAFISRYPDCKAGILTYNGREAVSLGGKSGPYRFPFSCPDFSRTASKVGFPGTTLEDTDPTRRCKGCRGRLQPVGRTAAGILETK